MASILQDDIDLITSINFDTILAAKMQLEFLEVDPESKKLFEDILLSQSLQFHEELQFLADSRLAQMMDKHDEDDDDESLDVDVTLPESLNKLADGQKPSDLKGKGKANRPITLNNFLHLGEESDEEELELQMPTLMDECGICFEGVTLYSSSSKSTEGIPFPGCKHPFCTRCLSTWVTTETKNGVKAFPLQCPEDKCRSVLEPGVLVRDLLADADLYKRFEERYLEATRRSMYCPNGSCAKLILLDENDEVDIDCTHCGFPVCAPCKSISHQPLTCDQFQALPQDQQGIHDISLFKLALSNRWARCPSCQHMIEKRDGCNHISCPCSCDFCYTCGRQYIDKNPIEGNPHGRPACNCSLFDVPDEPAQPVHVLRAGGARLVPHDQPAPQINMREILQRIRERREHQEIDGFRFGADRRRVPYYGDAEINPVRFPPWLRNYYIEARCHYCLRLFESFQAMESHLLMTRQHAVYFCCNRTFKTPECIQKHFDAVHVH